MLTQTSAMSDVYCLYVIAQATGKSAAGTIASNPWVMLGAAVAWASIWIQVAFKFYGKGEELHKDYHTEGVLNTARSAIESNSLIPALAQMFDRALEARADRRKNFVMAELLTAVQFLPDLEAAQKAMNDIQELDRRYGELKTKSSKIWKWTAAHALLTPIPVAVVAFVGIEVTWALVTLSVVAAAWAISLLMSIAGCVRFHSLMASFNNAIESHGGDST